MGCPLAELTTTPHHRAPRAAPHRAALSFAHMPAHVPAHVPAPTRPRAATILNAPSNLPYVKPLLASTKTNL